jgi:uncharacterized repeat protein (TIGR03847 family)
MSLPRQIELNSADFVTIDTIGPPGERTFYLQAAQGDTLITMVIEKEHAAALSIAIGGLLEQLDEGELEDIEEGEQFDMELVQPVEPLFRAGQLGLGYDEKRDMIVIIAEELVAEEEPEGTKVQIWGSRMLMAALAQRAAAVVASGRPLCPLCAEPIEADEPHVCVRGNGRKQIFSVDGS